MCLDWRLFEQVSAGRQAKIRFSLGEDEDTTDFLSFHSFIPFPVFKFINPFCATNHDLHLFNCPPLVKDSDEGVVGPALKREKKTVNLKMSIRTNDRSGMKPGDTSTRLVDYFVVVGINVDSQRSGECSGVTIQRFPEKDWDDIEHTPHIEVFCQPQGWALSHERLQPKFFAFVITNNEGVRHYCACLSFYEPISITPAKPFDEDEDTDTGVENSLTPLTATNSLARIPSSTTAALGVMFAPKVLAITSRVYQIEAFRHCLGTIYTVHSEMLSTPLETLVGNMLGHVQVPPAGGPQIRFSIGGGDRQALQPALNDLIPTTHTAVATLFQQLGINNVLTLFCALMTEQKILFHSSSTTRLTDACHGLMSLMYPFRYNHVYVPLLPLSIIDLTSSPTPFIIGILSIGRNNLPELLDVIVVDLDGGSIHVPEGVLVPQFPDPLWSETHSLLNAVLHPELSTTDCAFLPLAVKSSIPTQLDKELRAIFMRVFAILLQGYRSCLVIIRIHPNPMITFHKAKFLGQRGFIDNVFVYRLLHSMYIDLFIKDRGIPWRPTDLWDDLYNSIGDQLKLERQDSLKTMSHIQELAQLLSLNECPNQQPYVPKIVKPPEGAHSRIYSPVFPLLNATLVHDIILEGVAKLPLNRYNSVSKFHKARIVPSGPVVPEVDQTNQLMDNSARRLEVLRNCINCIFENKIFDARRSIHAVTRALKSHTAKLVLCQELSQHVTGNKAMLEPLQFDMVVNLMHCALQGNSEMDEHGVAAALLPLATSYCRKLCTGVIQFAFTCLQEHPVWKKQQFWESAFYADVEKDIKALYIPRVESTTFNNNLLTNSDKFKEGSKIEYSALDIAAEQMRIAGSLDADKLREFTISEESTVFSQAIHYANRMVFLLIPPDTQYKRQKDSTHHHSHHHHSMDDERVSNITSMAESDSIGGESGFEEQDPLVESGTSVVKFVSRFVDKVCEEGGVTQEHIRSLHSMIPGVVDMHIETLEAVYRESKRLPPTQKPKIPVPNLLPGEDCVMDVLRAYLLPDGRDIGTGTYGPVLLPAEGALFLTNYRLIFKGTPLDPLACEQVVIRTFPIASLTKEKRVTGQYLHHINRLLQDGIQLRSATFQLMKLAFDEEVTGENVDTFKKTLAKLRHPQHMFTYFAFAGQAPTPVPLLAVKDKNTTLRGFAKKTLMMTAKKAGLKSKQSKRHKYVLRSWAQGNGGTLPASTKYLSTSPIKPAQFSKEFADGDDLSLGSVESVGYAQEVSDDEFCSPNSPPHPAPASDSKSLERMMERSYYKDYRRMGLGSLTRTPMNSNAATILNKAESFRISSVNSNYSVCPTYPALVISPNQISDESLKKLSKCYRGNRFPVITWKHPRTRALLVRSSCLNKGLMGMLRGQGGSGAGVSDSSAHLDQENYLRAIVSLTPLALLKPGSPWATSDSNLSLDSLLIIGNMGMGVGPQHESQAPASQITPDISRKAPNTFAKAMDTLRYAGASGGKGIKTYKSWTAGRPKKPPIPVPPQTPNANAYKNTPKLSERESPTTEVRFQRAALYIFGEKSHFKGVRADLNPKIEYIPVEIPEVRHARTSFKKLMRVCIPSNVVTTDAENGFNRALELSDWMEQLSALLQLSGAIIDLIDVQGSSVMLCLEDGCDVTAQLSSIAQVCLDPYYRTFEGFQTLIEKEWLAFGHRFSNRNNMTGSEGPSSSAGFAPLFLQFLDLVHQIHSQFPVSFEFNEFYLKFLAYHSVSARFRTFLIDNEFERVEYGFMALDEKRGSLPRHYKGVDTGSDDEALYMSKQAGTTSHQSHLGQSIFEYIDKIHAKGPTFYNFVYCKDAEIQVLRPISKVSNLHLWDFFVNENLGTGASFDLEVAFAESMPKDEKAQDSQKDPRKFICLGYDIIETSIPNSFKQVLFGIHRLESDSGHLPQKWKLLWENLVEPPEVIDDKTLQRQTSISTEKVRSLSRSLHKRSTVDILVRGKYARSTDLSSVYSHSHRFERQTFTTLTNNCDSCSNILLGKTGLKCVDCGIKCHEKCIDGVPKCLGKGVAIPEAMTNSVSAISPNADAVSIASRDVPVNHTSHQAFYDQFQSNISEDRTHEGYLYKRGALLKAWKQRWFVLDSTKHQLRYYDAMEESQCKGIIDLSEVQIATSSAPSAGAPKKVDERSFFDIRTTRRTYNFCASDAASAQEWVEKIQQCIC